MLKAVLIGRSLAESQTPGVVVLHSLQISSKAVNAGFSLARSQTKTDTFEEASEAHTHRVWSLASSSSIFLRTCPAHD